jgi:hypothetical protein
MSDVQLVASLCEAAKEDPEATAFVEALRAKGFDWIDFIHDITADNWPAIREFIDDLVKDQPVMVRILWRIARQAIEKWLETGGAGPA